VQVEGKSHNGREYYNTFG